MDFLNVIGWTISRLFAIKIEILAVKWQTSDETAVLEIESEIKAFR